VAVDIQRLGVLEIHRDLLVGGFLAGNRVVALEIVDRGGIDSPVIRIALAGRIQLNVEESHLLVLSS